MKMIGPSLLIALIGLLWWRAGSINIIMERLWRLISGDKIDSSEPQYLHEEFLKNTRNLEKFRFIFRVPVKTIEERDKFISWSDRNKLDTRDVQKAHRWLNPSDDNPIKAPKKITKWIAGILTFLCYTLVILLSTLYTQPFAGLIMKESRVWFLADQKTVRKYLSDEFISLKKCQDNAGEISSQMGFNEKETAAICNAFKDESLNPYIEETIKSQKQFFGITTFFAAILLLWSLLFARSISAAERIIEKTTSNTRKTP